MPRHVDAHLPAVELRHLLATQSEFFTSSLVMLGVSKSVKANRFGRAALLVAGGLALLGLAGTTFGSAFSGNAVSNTIRDYDVQDLESGRRYLEQEIHLFLPDLSVKISGTFEYQRVPGAQVVKFLSEQGIVDEVWAVAPETATVVSWKSSEVTFQMPRPRPGVDAKLNGDTFFVILDPGDGRKLTGVVQAEALATLRAISIERHSEALALGPWN